MGRGGGDSSKPGASEAASLVFRIATVGLSLASAIMTVASKQCVHSDGRGGSPTDAGAGTVSYSDYNSFKFSALAELLSAVLQGVAIYLEVVGKEKAAKTVELIDKLVLALTASSAALLLAVDDITSCGPPRRPARGSRQRSSLCDQAGRFCSQVRLSSALSLAATVSVSASVYTRHVPVRVAATVSVPASVYTRHVPVSVLVARPRPPPPPPAPVIKIDEPEPEQKKKKEEEEKKKENGQEGRGGTSHSPSPDRGLVSPPEEGTNEKKDEPCCTLLTPPAMPPPPCPRPYCGCPRLTIPCSCENPELCRAFF